MSVADIYPFRLPSLSCTLFPSWILAFSAHRDRGLAAAEELWGALRTHLEWLVGAAGGEAGKAVMGVDEASKVGGYTHQWHAHACGCRPSFMIVSNGTSFRTPLPCPAHFTSSRMSHLLPLTPVPCLVPWWCFHQPRNRPSPRLSSDAPQWRTARGSSARCEKKILFDILASLAR